MASNSQETTYDAEGQAHVKKEELPSHATQPDQSAKESSQHGADQSGSILQQTSQQVKSMAQGAADAVKNTLGMGGNAASPANPANPTSADPVNPTSDMQH